ncbi:MAG: hypothetical protein JSS31_06660 [Proteobacteria bacterium]|nr:hypothetical protein [Pseudomonadota bacterium]MBS0493632.1 hypothetical protein [Pseudomonadota bacterium]
MSSAEVPASPILQALLALPAAASDQPSKARGRKPATAFHAQGQLPLTALAVQVADMGDLPLPLSDAQAQALHALTQPAPFGLREQTLHDRSVRDTGELDAEALTLR